MAISNCRRSLFHLPHLLKYFPETISKEPLPLSPYFRQLFGICQCVLILSRIDEPRHKRLTTNTVRASVWYDRGFSLLKRNESITQQSTPYQIKVKAKSAVKPYHQQSHRRRYCNVLYYQLSVSCTNFYQSDTFVSK